MNKNVRICFIANFHKTYVFHELARRLASRGTEVFWIVTKRDQHYFLKKNYPADRILYISRANTDLHNEPVADLRLNELVYGDRVFKHHLSEGLQFLRNIQRPVYDFLRRNGIRFVFGEITWAHELLVMRMVKKLNELNCMYLDCSVIRIPNKRFAFFTDENQNEMLEFDESFSGPEVIELEKPFYLQINDKIIKRSSSVTGRLARVKRFITGENIEKSDPNVITDMQTRFIVSSKEELNRLNYRRLRTLELSDVESSNFVFVGFHKQPESSIDVSGRYHEDQALNIINIWRMLPDGWKIVLKEHTNAIGDRSLHYYKRLLAYPGIVMVNETTDSRKLIEKSRLVATVTGTIAYEAALIKKPAITFSPIFFNHINYCRHVPIHELVKYPNLTDLVKELEEAEDNRADFSSRLMKNSFEGFLTDHVSAPSVLEEHNLAKLVEGFQKLFNRYA